MKIKPARVGSIAGALVLLAQGLAMQPANAAPDPALAWTQTNLAVSGYQGFVIDAPVEFTYSGSITKPAVKVAGQFADTVTVDLTKAQPTTPGRATATIHVELPPTQTASYVDNLQFTVNDQPLPKPLHLTVTPKPLDPNAVPDDLGFPSASRITTLEGSSVISDQLVVYVDRNDPSPDQTIKQVAANVSGFVVGSASPERRYEILMPGSALDATIANRAKVAAMPHVSAADIDVLGQEFGYTNDPIWQPTPSSHTDQNWNLTQIDAPGAWNTTNGSGVNIALIDGGVYGAQRDLAGQIGHDEEVPGSYVAHGTHVAGTMCAKGDNGIGTVGVASGCNLSVYGVYTTSDGKVHNGLYARVDEIIGLSKADSPKIVNLSLGTETRFDCTNPNLTPSQQLVVNQMVDDRNAMIERLKARPDILWVFASGDHGQDSSCSAYGDLGNRSDLPNVVTVAASGIKADLPSYSVRGSGITVAAPGGYLQGVNSVQGVYSTMAPCAFGHYLIYICPEYDFMSGTSMSAPHVAGIAALAFAARPGITVSRVKECITTGASQGGKQIARGMYIANANDTVECAKVPPAPPAPDVLHGISSIAVSMNHSLAVANNGLVYAWGSNSSGQLGLGTTADARNPQWVTGIDSVNSVAVGLGASYAIKSDGSLWAWGDNSYGQLGDGATGNTLSPARVAGVPSAKSIITGTYETNAIVTGTDGSVWAWGQNRQGELGVGSRDTVTLPARVNVPVAVSEVVSGYWTTYAIGTDGSVWAWGENSYGQLGDGTTNPALTPQRVPGVDSVKQLVSGGAFETTYALRTDGSLMAWGKTGTDGKLITPHPVATADPIAQLAAGGDVVFARTTTDRLFAWGNGYCGSLGIGQDGTVSTPTQITGGGVGQGLVMNVATTDYGNSTYAVLSDGSVWAWGAGGDGEMGNGTAAACTATPTQVSSLNIAAQVVTAQGAFGNSAAAFAIQSDGSVWSWGLNYGTNLGQGGIWGNALTPKRI